MALEANGKCVTSETDYDILLGIAPNRGMTESIYAELAEAPDAETIRRYFDQQFTVEQLLELERRINAGLASNWPKKLRRSGPIEVAFDFYDRPYYGKQKQNEGKDEEFTAQVAVCSVFTTFRRTKRGKRRADWLLFVMINLNWTPEKCRQRYRKRFGIETSYRLAHKSLGWTTSPNPAYRFVLIDLGDVLLNLWMHL